MIVAWLFAVAALAHAPLIDEPLAVASPAHTRMELLVIPPSPKASSTAGLPGHRHPGATYVYVVSGAVLSRLGDGPERRFSTGEAWSEAPGQAHYIVNASTTEPAKLLVTFIVPEGTYAYTQPLGAGPTKAH